MNQPEILIVGAGGMGALFGSILHENGLDVVLYDTNTEHIRAIQQAGLKIEGYGGDRTIPIPATSTLSELESANHYFSVQVTWNPLSRKNGQTAYHSKKCLHQFPEWIGQ